MERHGYKNTRIYTSWQQMKVRCGNTNSKDYHNYGGRGITVCDRWLTSFKNFLEDMGDRPDDKTLDRIDNSKGYYKENCRWATIKEQANNNRANRRIELDGEVKTMSEWSDVSGIAAGTIARRLKIGWSAKRAVFEDLGKARIGVPHNEVIYTYDGKSMNLKEWAKSIGIGYHALHKRIHKYGLSFEEAILKPPRKKAYAYYGETKTVKEWAEVCGIHKSTLSKQITKIGFDKAIVRYIDNASPA